MLGLVRSPNEDYAVSSEISLHEEAISECEMLISVGEKLISIHEISISECENSISVPEILISVA